MAKLLKTLDYRTTFNDLGYKIELNEVSWQIELNGSALNSFLESEIVCRVRERGGKNESQVLHQIKYAAHDNRYHPIKRYLNGLSYDGKDYLSELCAYFKADNYFKIWLNRWLIAAVARAVQGAQCPVLVLDGPQNIGKSGFARWLCSSPKIKEYFTEGPINPDAKDTRIRATEKWIWEASEFGSTTRRADVEALKAFITLGEVTERAPYERQDQKRPMLACFIGTINNGHAGFLADPSGNRRFLVTHVDEIDWKGYVDHCNPDNIWAQAYTSYLMGEPFQLTPDELKLSVENNENYQVPDALESLFERLFEVEANPITFTPTADIIEALQDAGFKAGTTNALSKQLSETLAKIGLQKMRQRYGRNPNPVWGYFGVKRII